MRPFEPKEEDVDFWEGYDQAVSEYEDRIAELEDIIQEYEEKAMGHDEMLISRHGKVHDTDPYAYDQESLK